MQLKLSAGDFKNNKTGIRNPEAEKKPEIKNKTSHIINNSQ